VLADRSKVPLAVEGLRPPVPLPHAEPYSVVPCLPRLVYARAHQRLPNTTAEPFKRHVQPHQFDGLSAFDASRRLAGVKLGVTRREPADFREQEGGGGIGQLRRLLGETEGSGDVGRHVLRGVIRGERFGEGTGTQFGQQTGVLAVGATDLHIGVLIHTIHLGNNEAAETTDFSRAAKRRLERIVRARRYSAAIPIPARPLDVRAYRLGETVASSKRKLRHSLRAMFALLVLQQAASP